MPVPTVIGDLSTTASSNYPSGAESPAVLDDVQRAHAAFIAQIRDDYASVTGAQTLTNKTLTEPVLKTPAVIGTTETVYTITDGASVDLDPDNGGIQLWTLGANRTCTASSFGNGQSMVLMVNDGSAYNITFPSMTWLSVTGVKPVLATSGYTVIVLWKAGGVLYGMSNR